METAHHEILETVTFDHRPAFQFAGGYDLVVAGAVGGGIGIHACRTDDLHQLVKLIGDRNLRTQIRYTVDDMVDGLPLLRVSFLAVLLVQFVYLVQIGAFLFIVGRAVVGCTLEHDMLLVMRQTGGLQRVVLTAGPDGDEGLYLRFDGVLTQIHRQTVLESVDTCAGRITGYRLVIDCLRCKHQ